MMRNKRAADEDFAEYLMATAPDAVPATLPITLSLLSSCATSDLPYLLSSFAAPVSIDRFTSGLPQDHCQLAQASREAPLPTVQLGPDLSRHPSLISQATWSISRGGEF